MYRPYKNDSQNPKELKKMIDLIKNNVDCSKDIINRIDTILETKQLSKPILDALVTQRNACAVTVMNFNRVINRI